MLPPVKERLSQLYRVRRAALEAEAAVLDAEDDEAGLVSGLAEAIEEARGLPDRIEGSFRLQVLADLLPKVWDPGALALLVDVLDDRDPSVRARAMMNLAAASQTRFPEVVRVVQDALDAGLRGPALLELPGLLLDCAGSVYPPPVDILVTLTDHDDGDVVAEAVCALAELDVSGVRELLESLREDGRTLSDLDDGPSTLGELVEDLLATLELDDAVAADGRSGGEA